MKTTIGIYITTLILTVLLIGISSCNDDEISESEKVMSLLTNGGSWKVNKVEVDNADETTVYAGLIIEFSKTSFTASNGEPVWPATDTWSFPDNSGKSFIRGDGIVVSIDEITQNSLTLSLTWDKTTIGSGRMNSVKGKNKFKFNH